MKQIFTGILLLSLFFISCKSSKQKGISKNVDTITVSAFNNPLNIYRASAPLLWTITNTRVALSFNYKEKTANGTEWLSLQPYFYPTDSLTLDAKGMKILSVSIGHSDKPLQYTYDSVQLRIKLDKIYTKNETVKLSIKYVAMPYQRSSSGSSAISDDKGLYFINTDHKIPGKPAQIWTQGETEANSNWLPTIDKPNVRTPIQLELTVPFKYKTLGNGALISSMDNGDTRTDIWKMDQPIQIYAIMFAIGDFAIAKDKWKNKEVNYYVEQAYATYARKMFQHTPEMMEFFSNATGVPYPWNKYSQVVVRDFVSGAMENTSASLFGEFMNQDHNEYADANHEDVVAHELFHQWFGDYVTAESWSNLTVNESFATYGEYLWRKHKYGSSYADELGYSYLQRYLNQSEYGDPMLVRHFYNDKEDMFDRVSYQKGGAILHYLHQLIGDSAFYNSMQLYLSKNPLQAAEATHWRLAVEQVTGKDWNWFFDQWYHRAGHPELDLNYNYDDAAQKLTVTVTQKQNASIGNYKLPLKSLLLFGEEKQIVDWNISKAKEVFIYEYKNGVAPVVVPDVVHVLPGKISEHKTHKQWLQQLNGCDDFISQLLAVENVNSKDISDPDAQMILSKALDNKTAAIRYASLETIESASTDLLIAKWKQDVVAMATSDGNNSVRAFAIEILGKWKEKDQKQLMLDALKDNSYLVSGNALYALKGVDPELAYTLAKSKLRTKANTNLDSKAWKIIADKAAAEDTVLFIESFKKTSDAENRKHFIKDLANYAANTKSEAAFLLTLGLLAQKIESLENKKQRAIDVSYLTMVRESLSNKEAKTPLYLYKLREVKVAAARLNGNEKENDIKKVYEEILK